MADAQAQGIAAPAVALAPGQAGAINLKIENAKLTIFYGLPGKDTITAAYMVQRIQDLTATNHWSPEDAYHHFSLALQGSAQEWLRTLQAQGDKPEKTWTYVEPLFWKEFTTDEDDTALLDQLSNLQKRPNERTRDYASRINRIIELLKRSNLDTPAVPPPANLDGTYTQAEVLKYGEIRDERLFRFFSFQLFKVGLPEDVRKVIHQQKPDSMFKAMDIASAQERTKDKDSRRPVHAVEEENFAVKAIQPTFQPSRPQNNYAPQQRQNNWNKQPQQQQQPYGQRNQQPNQHQGAFQQQQQRPRNNTYSNNSTNGKPTCMYCRIPGHHQDDCRKRIAANAPCMNAAGKPCYPKSVNEISNQDPSVNLVQPVQDFLY